MCFSLLDKHVTKHPVIRFSFGNFSQNRLAKQAEAEFFHCDEATRSAFQRIEENGWRNRSKDGGVAVDSVWIWCGSVGGSFDFQYNVLFRNCFVTLKHF